MSVNGKIYKTLECVPCERGFSFAKNTTFGLGGKAKIAYFPKSIRQATAVYDFLSFNDINFYVLGNGSNILASDKFFDGAIIGTRNLKGIYRTGKNTIFCRSGTTVSDLLKYCLNSGAGGLEYLAGIPATVGGLVCMNGGAGGSYIGDNVLNVKLYDGKLRKLSKKECSFGYKQSTMRDINSLILGAELVIKPAACEEIKELIENYLKLRRAQPKGRSCGCVFKNVDGVSAGKIIDEAGLKGLTNGGAYVSREHANFIINNGANSSDVYELICEVKRRVYEDKGILLEEEVVYIGDF